MLDASPPDGRFWRYASTTKRYRSCGSITI